MTLERPKTTARPTKQLNHAGTVHEPLRQPPSELRGGGGQVAVGVIFGPEKHSSTVLVLPGLA